MKPLIDTHCHVNFHAFDTDSEEVIRAALTEQTWMINVGTNYATSKRSVELAERIGRGMVASIGIHPIHLAKDIIETAVFDGKEYAFTTKQEGFDKRAYYELAQSKKVVAIGESGLDFYHLDHFKSDQMTADEYVQLQTETLYEILSFAREVELPHIFHCRDAYDEFVDIVRDFGEDVRGVMHCFTGTPEQVRNILDLGLYIGFTGIITFPNAGALREVVKIVPLDRLLLETDSPYLAPQAYRGKRNQPLYVAEVARMVAQIKGVSYEEVVETTTQNAYTAFHLASSIES